MGDSIQDRRRTVIVTASDANYISYLDGLLSSIEAHRPIDSGVEIMLLDAGLTPSQLSELSRRVQRIVAPEWHLDFPDRASRPGWFRALCARPFLPRYAEGYDLILWVDADCWLADWRAIDLLIRGSMKGQLAIVPELHRAYGYLYNRGRARQTVYECASAGWGEEVGARLTTLPILNAGVFAMECTARHWEVYAALLNEGVQKTTHSLVEQCALNIAVYRERCPVHLLPAWCNWICYHAAPVVDRQRRCLCEMYLPYEKLSLVHLTGQKGVAEPLATTDGQQVESRLDYHSVREMLARL